MKRKVFILVPSDINSSPVKGACALANEIHRLGRDVTLVTIRSKSGASLPLENDIAHIRLSEVARGWMAQRKTYREILEKAGGRAGTASISSCFSADLLNAGCSDVAVTCGSVRGNLFQAYRMDYGLIGLAVAQAHYQILRRLDAVTAMTGAMAMQIRRHSRVDPIVIGNFIEESALSPFRGIRPRSDALRFVFVGSLAPRKQPMLMLGALARLSNGGGRIFADFIGDGVMRNELEQKAQDLGLGDSVRFHGFVKEPYALIAQAHALVLPSLSEGVSRAALEALYLGVPCVIRAVDGNGELIEDGINGALFSDDEELPEAMLRACSIARNRDEQESMLLTDAFRQRRAVAGYLDLVDNLT